MEDQFIKIPMDFVKNGLVGAYGISKIAVYLTLKSFIFRGFNDTSHYFKESRDILKQGFLGAQLSQLALAELLYMRRQSIAEILKGLENDGLVQKYAVSTPNSTPIYVLGTWTMEDGVMKEDYFLDRFSKEVSLDQKEEVTAYTSTENIKTAYENGYDLNIKRFKNKINKRLIASPRVKAILKEITSARKPVIKNHRTNFYKGPELPLLYPSRKVVPNAVPFFVPEKTVQNTAPIILEEEATEVAVQPKGSYDDVYFQGEAFLNAADFDNADAVEIEVTTANVTGDVPQEDHTHVPVEAHRGGRLEDHIIDKDLIEKEIEKRRDQSMRFARINEIQSYLEKPLKQEEPIEVVTEDTKKEKSSAQKERSTQVAHMCEATPTIEQDKVEISFIQEVSPKEIFKGVKKVVDPLLLQEYSGAQNVASKAPVAPVEPSYNETGVTVPRRKKDEQNLELAVILPAPVLEDRKPAVKKEKVKTVFTSIYDLWNEKMSHLFPDLVVGAWGAKEWGQLKTLTKKYGANGDSIIKNYVGYVFDNWSELKRQYRITSETPTMNLLCSQYHQEIVPKSQRAILKTEVATEPTVDAELEFWRNN